MEAKIKAFIVILALVLVSIGCDTGTSASDNNEPNDNNETNGNNGAGDNNEQFDKRPIVCFGDSLTEGYGASIPGQVDKSKSYPAFLQSKVRVPVINTGISGDTAAGGLARVERDVLSHDPQAVIILLGANDFFRLRPANATKADLQNIITRVRDENRKIFLVSFMGGSSWENSLIDSIPGMTPAVLSILISGYKRIYLELVLENPDVTFISDIWTGVWGVNMSDPIHPNAEGYRIMADHIFLGIKPYLLENNLM
jgi:acyl-CoA thioesterase-1